MNIRDFCQSMGLEKKKLYCFATAIKGHMINWLEPNKQDLLLMMATGSIPPQGANHVIVVQGLSLWHAAARGSS